MKSVLLHLIIVFSLSIYGQKNDYLTENKKLYTELILLSKKKFNNEKKAFVTLKSFENRLKKQNVDSLFGLYYRVKFNFCNDFLKRDLALKNIELSIEYYKKANNLKQLALSIMNKGNLSLWQGDYTNALKIYYDALKITENNKFAFQSALLYKNIGVLFSNQEKDKEALQYANKALQIFESLKDEEQIALILINIGNCYFNQYDADNALKYYLKAANLSQKINNYDNLSFVYNNIGSVYIEDKKDTLYGLKYLKKSIAIRKKSYDLNGLIFSYNNIANVYIGLKKYDLAEENIFLARKMAIISKNKFELAESYRLLSFLNESKKDFKLALHFQKLYKTQKDSLINEKNNKDVLELEAKYQTEKKEKQILQQQAEVKQKNIWLLLVTSILLIGFVIFRNYKLKSKLEKEQLEIENKLLEEQSNYKIQEQRLEISRELHDNVGSQLTFILSILDNLKNSPVQFEEAIDKKIDTLSNFASKSIAELRDTIWVLNAKQLSLFELKSRMLNFIKDAGESTDTVQFDFKFEINEDIQLSSKQTINSYRVLQEIVNNAIKHAKATFVEITINQTGNQLEMNVSDNGKGFDFEEKKKKSFGLTNIQIRIQEINGDLKVESTIEKGTYFSINIPLKHD